MQRRTGFVPAFFIFSTLAANTVLAQPAPQSISPENGAALSDDAGVLPSQIDPEDRNHGVARVSLLNGDVSVRRGDSGDFVAAAINAPLLAQDSVQTGPSSRAELQFDTSNRVRFANDTEARISQLTADRFQLQIGRGTLTWSVLADGPAQVEIATPSVAIHPTGRGDYRISVMPDGTTQITVRQGSVEVYTPRGVERVEAGQTMLARGAVDNPEFQLVGAIAPDEWDLFNDRRDRELAGSQSYNYVSRDIPGAEDLDNYGQWNSDPTYGQVWTPRVAADWAPYRLGRWANEDYYGWTWVSSDPWGWAPYHYGSWFQGNYGWSWYPGSRYTRSYYRPALVAFFGFGRGGGIGIGGGWGFGNVGWVPLAPYERFHPWYGRSAGSFGRNGGRGYIVGNTNITNLYRNARGNNGVTSINSHDFASGHFGRYNSPGMGQLQQAGAVRGQMPFAPTSNHNRFNDRQTTVQPRTNFGQTRFADHMPTGSGFGRQSGSGNSQPLRQSPQNGQSFGGSSNWNRFGTPNRTIAPQASYQQQQSGSFGRQQSQQGSFTNRSSQPQSGQTPYGGASSNWQRFGDPSSARQQDRNAAPANSNYRNSYRQSDQQPSSQTQRYDRGSQSVQVSPPVVRERSSGSSRPTYSSQQQDRSFGRPAYSAPSSNQQPRYSSPQNNSQSSRSYSPPRQESRQQSAPRQESNHQSSHRTESSSNHDGGSRNRK